MRFALPHPAIGVTVPIFASAGALAGMTVGGFQHTLMGLCLGITLGALVDGSGLVRFGYVAATAILLYAGQLFYAPVLLPECQSAQVRWLEKDLPTGSTFQHVDRFLKQRHIDHVAVPQQSAPESDNFQDRRPRVIVAEYNTRCLLSMFHFRTTFIFDKHDRLRRCRVDQS